MSKTIVHADDSASVRRWVAEQLNDMNLKVVSVSDGEAALDVLRETPCDLLLTDLEMPNLDGLAPGRSRSRVAGPSIPSGSRAVLPASHGVRCGPASRSDRMDGQTHRLGASPSLGSPGLAGLG